MLGVGVPLVGLMCGVDEAENVADGIMLMEVWWAKCDARRCAFNLLVQPSHPRRGVLSLNGKIDLVHDRWIGMRCFLE